MAVAAMDTGNFWFNLNTRYVVDVHGHNAGSADQQHFGDSFRFIHHHALSVCHGREGLLWRPLAKPISVPVAVYRGNGKTQLY